MSLNDILVGAFLVALAAAVSRSDDIATRAVTPPPTPALSEGITI